MSFPLAPFSACGERIKEEKLSEEAISGTDDTKDGKGCTLGMNNSDLEESFSSQLRGDRRRLLTASTLRHN